MVSSKNDAPLAGEVVDLVPLQIMIPATTRKKMRVLAVETGLRMPELGNALLEFGLEHAKSGRLQATLVQIRKTAEVRRKAKG